MRERARGMARIPAPTTNWKSIMFLQALRIDLTGVHEVDHAADPGSLSDHTHLFFTSSGALPATH